MITYIFFLIAVVAFLFVVTRYSIKIGTGKMRSTQVASAAQEYYEPEYIA